MAGFASQSALRSKLGDLVESGASNLPETTEVTKGLKNVVGWLKQASIEVKEAGKRAIPNVLSSTVLARDSKKMSTATNNSLCILHYNDIYNIDANSSVEPIGGAARFSTAIKSFSHLNPLILFSGDAFSPSMLSTFTKGEQMVPVLNDVGTMCAVFGNHDFDHGLEVLAKHTEETNFPWLMSNVIDNETGRPLGSGKITHFLLHNNIRIGLIGLVEKEWLDTLPTIDSKEVTYIDFVQAGNDLADELRNEGCEIIIALTHMRTPNDLELAKNCSKIDLILGGHDHVFEVNVVNGINVIKSGTDFRQFSKITINKDRNSEGKLDLSVEQIDVTSKYAEDKALKDELLQYSSTIESKMGEVLGNFCVELNGLFSSIRTSETNLGNWVCDVVLSATGADVVIINSGTFRSDQIHPAGPFTMKDLVSVVPMRDPLVVLEVTGKDLLDALENAVSAYPKLEGRFPQVSGISFVFNSKKPPGSRIEPQLVQVADEWLNLDQTYSLCVKSYMYGGCDGFTMFKDKKVLMDDDECPELGLAIQNHFHAINVRTGKAKHSKHRQSLVTLSRRHSMVQMLEDLDLDGPSPVRRRISLVNQPKSVDISHNKNKLCRRASLEDLEQVSCQLAPTIQHRIIVVESDEYTEQLIRKRQTMANTDVIKEDDENYT
ncbi:Trifunctional nucleotide phosphoesterase protein YfkN [Pseudolycoriella hygida]|uniref:Trifunctional nucleotide phosphoesterase protein YfkN n=1 Tax=Pseudolycoriella hygida TaxID=35572 RepID=A0A9Q0NGI7_9DIPT|nr:Trifunctional nucleotide phosphoesterase protein YfkN [Pseudolycoriella hygida]